MSEPRRRGGIAALDIAALDVSAFNIAALDIGAHAASRLSERSRGRVLAVFARGVHVLFDEGLVLTVGDASLGSGPANLLVASDGLDALGGTRPGDVVTTPRRGVLRIDRKAGYALHDTLPTTPIEIDWAEASRYRTPPPPPAPEAATLRAARTRLAALDDIPMEGFGWRLRSAASVEYDEAIDGKGSPLDRYQRALRDVTRVAAKALDDWLVDAMRDEQVPSPNRVVGRSPPDAVVCPAPTAVRPLLGAGPGLTPSGDDLLSGVLLALHRLRRPEAADALWRTLAPVLGERTHPFSSAQLALAASGEHAAAAGALLDTVFDVRPVETDDPIASTLRTRLDTIGATSGWDLAAGIAAVIDACLAASDRSVPASLHREAVLEAVTRDSVDDAIGSAVRTH